MTNNTDDFEPQEQEHDPSIEPQRTGLGANLASAWRSQPLFKLFVLMVVVAAIAAVSVGFFSGSSTTHSAAGFVKPPDLNEAPGGQASPYMKSQTELANAKRSKDALDSGGSAIPTPVGQVDQSEIKPDPLNELRAEIETMKAQKAQPQQRQQQQPEPFDDSLAQAMQRQMSTLVESWTPKGVKQVVVTKEDENGKSGTAAGAGTTAGSTNSANMPQQKIIVPAGTVSYAQLLTEANSDVPGPILAQVVSGPLNGARVVGSFQVANGYSDYLVLQFTLADIKGKDYPMSAIALDPDTTLGGMATEVDQRYFTRVILPAAAGFLQGFGSALGQGSSQVTENGQTTIVSQSGHGLDQGAFQGLASAAQTASQFFQNQANQTKPLVRVAAGTPMGLFFVSSVIEQPQQPSTFGGQQASGYPNGMGPNGAPMTSYAPGGYAPTAGGYPGMTGYGQPAAYNPSAYGSTQSGVPYPNYGTSGMNSNPYGMNTGMPMTGYPGASAYYPH